VSKIVNKILNVGIDISLNKACCCLLSQEGEYLCPVFEVDNNPCGFDMLKARILEATKEGDFCLIHMGFEASSMYGYHLAEYFKQTILPSEVKVYMINAKYIHRFKKAFPEKEKTDLVDAQFVAEYLRFGKLPVEYEPDRLYLPLKRLIRYRYHLVKSLEREKKLFVANLFLKFPGWVQAKPIKTLNKTSFDVLAEFSVDELTRMPLDELTLFVARAGKNRCPDPEAIAAEIKKAARESYRIREDLSSSVTFILASIHRNITALSKALKELNKAIQAQSGEPPYLGQGHRSCIFSRDHSLYR
jgi:transposase